MNLLDKLYKFIDDNNIRVFYIKNLELNHNISGLYHCKDCPIILLDSELHQNNKEHIAVLAEECGHYSTSYGYNIKEIENIDKNFNISKCEYKADKWKNKFLIPDDILNNLLLKFNNIFDIAEYLAIDTEIVLNRLTHLSYQYRIYELNENISIDLTKLPNLVKINKGVDIYEEP